MIPDDTGKQLHDKATRGMPLTTEAEAHLKEWYARLDEEESRLLAAAAPPSDLEALRRQVHAILAEIITVTQKIQAVTRENEALRKEIAALQERLPRKVS